MAHNRIADVGGTDGVERERAEKSFFQAGVSSRSGVQPVLV